MGKVTALFFLPGMMCDERLFSSQVSALSADFDCTVVGFDQEDSIEAYAQHVLNQLSTKRLELNTELERVVLIGLSMGGIVAMECMRQAPNQFDAVVLMDTNPLAEDPSRRRLRPPQIQRALEGELETILIDEMKPLYLAPGNQSNEQILSIVLSMAKTLGAEVFARQSKALMNRGDNTRALSNWEKPTLILCGVHDKLCPPARHRMMQRLMPHAQLVEIEEAGHLPTLEVPQLVNERLFSFIDSLN